MHVNNYIFNFCGQIARITLLLYGIVHMYQLIGDFINVDCKNLQLHEDGGGLDKCTEETPMFGFTDEVHLAKVVRCYDGDTIFVCFRYGDRYHQFKVRLFGFDSFELHPSLKIPKKVRSYIVKRAEKATQRLEELILGKNVYLFCKDYDMYGRILGIIKLNPEDEKTINDIMLEENHGYIYSGGTKDVGKINNLPKYVQNYFDKQRTIK